MKGGATLTYLIYIDRYKVSKYLNIILIQDLNGKEMPLFFCNLNDDENSSKNSDKDNISGKKRQF